MKALVWKGVGDIQLQDVSEPKIKEKFDAIVKITTAAICGTDLHMIRGTMPGMKPGTVLGHEGVGIIEELGKEVRNLKVGDRVVIPSTVGCGYCSYCRSGYFAQCDNANAVGEGTAFYGGPATAGGLNGMQAEKVRVPYANVNLVKLPDEVTDEQAIMLSDIFPTAYFGAHLAEIKGGDTVAVFGCGPVGIFAIVSAKLRGASRVLAIDCVESRLEMARAQGAEVINFDKEDPVQTIKDLTGKIGVDRVIDAVGVDAQMPSEGPARKKAMMKAKDFEEEVKQIAPVQHPSNGNWHPGNAPSQVLDWAVESVCKAGTIAIIGVYPETATTFPIGKAMNKNLTIKAGNCNHRRYIPELLELVRTGAVDPSKVLTQMEPISDIIEAYKAFDERSPGWVKVEVKPQKTTAR